MSVKLVPNSIAGQAVSPEQQAYLSGFFSGLGNRGLSFEDAEPEAGPKAKKTKVIPEERIKNELHPFDALPVLRKRARLNEAPEKEDIFRFKWNGLFWLGPVHEGYMCRLRIPGGIVQAYQLRELTSIADDLAWGYLQITTRNNFQLWVIEPKDTPELLQAMLADAGLACEANYIRGGVAACTGNRYCKFASSDTKGHAIELVDYLESKITLDQPLNIHITGCPHSCAQHYIGDIGLLACKVKIDGQQEPTEGYHVFVGGGFGEDNKRLDRQLLKKHPVRSGLE